MTRALVLLFALAGASLAGCGEETAPIAPACDDGVSNGTETGVDCGGGTCGVCDDGEGCSQAADCDSGVCSDGGICVAIACTDGLLNGDETDVDCGGSCDLCAVGDRCEVAGDCASELCGDSGLCVAGACGDGVVTGDEDCDDGGESATCNADCSAATCGDLVVNDAAGEQCDSGGVDTLGCDADCTLRSCGDGTTNSDAGERCDDGGANTATCDLDCSVPSCGDGLYNAAAGESCDDGGDSYVCNADCSLATCGDSYVNAAHLEDCDDGGESATCNADCTNATCGDGVFNETAGEDCDDAGESATCNADCTLAACGDGVTNETAGEDCDGAGESSACNADCTIATCGDGVTNETAGEDCDDAGESATCNADCTAAVCGDGIVNAAAGETCDDGNTDDGDGCSAVCEFQACNFDTALLPAVIHPNNFFGQIAFDGSCDLLITGGLGSSLFRVSGTDGSVSNVVSSFGGSLVTGVAFRESDGLIYVATDASPQLWQVDSAGVATLVMALPNVPNAVAVAPAGFGIYANQIFVVGTDSTVYAIDPALAVALPVGTTAGTLSDITFAPDGSVAYLANNTNGTVQAMTPAGDFSTVASGLSGPDGLAVTLDGSTLWVAHFGGGARLDSIDVAAGTVTPGPSVLLDGGYYVTGLLVTALGDVLYKTSDGAGSAIVDAYTP